MIESMVAASRGDNWSPKASAAKMTRPNKPSNGKVGPPHAAGRASMAVGGGILPMTQGGVGTVYGTSLYVDDTVSIYWCGTGPPCTLTSQIAVEFRYTITGNISFAFSADANVVYGKAVTFQQTTCYTYWNNWPWDQVVNTWGTCGSQMSGPGLRMGISAYGESWSDGGYGQTYHPDYDMQIVNSAGVQFGFHWRAADYYIDNNGSTYWL